MAAELILTRLRLLDVLEIERKRLKEEESLHALLSKPSQAIDNLSPAESAFIATPSTQYENGENDGVDLVTDRQRVSQHNNTSSISTEDIFDCSALDIDNVPSDCGTRSPKNKSQLMVKNDVTKSVTERHLSATQPAGSRRHINGVQDSITTKLPLDQAMEQTVDQTSRNAICGNDIRTCNSLSQPCSTSRLQYLHQPIRGKPGNVSENDGQSELHTNTRRPRNSCAKLKTFAYVPTSSHDMRCTLPTEVLTNLEMIPATG